MAMNVDSKPKSQPKPEPEKPKSEPAKPKSEPAKAEKADSKPATKAPDKPAEASKPKAPEPKKDTYSAAKPSSQPSTPQKPASAPAIPAAKQEKLNQQVLAAETAAFPSKPSTKPADPAKPATTAAKPADPAKPVDPAKPSTAAQAAQKLQEVGQKLGITKPEDLKKLEPAAPDLIKAFDAAKNGNVKDAAKSVGDAVNKLPQDLKDKAKTLVAEEILKNPTAKTALDKVGLGKPQDLAKAGDALPKLYDAGQALAKTPPETGAALKSLGEAYKALPESSKQTISDKVMGTLPKDVKDFAGKIGISKLDDLAKLGPALPDVGKAFDAAKEGKLDQAAKAMGAAVGKLPTEMQEKAKLAIADKILENPTAKGVLDKVGLGKAEDLAKAGDALPKLVDAGQALAKQPPDVGKALTSLGEAYSKLPDSSRQAISDKVMGALPKDVKDFAGKIGISKLDDFGKLGPAMPSVAKALDAAKEGKLDQAAKAMGEAVSKLPTEMQEKAKLAIADKILENPTAKGVLDKVGLGKAEDLAKAGDALPKLVDAGQALAKQPPDVGKALTSLGEAYSKLPDSSRQAISDKVMGALPKDVKDFAGKIGISKLDDFGKLGPAMPSVAKALDAAKEGKLDQAAKAMGEAVSKLPTEMQEKAKLAIADKILENPTAKGVLDKVGLGKAEDLAKAGDALPKLVDAGQALAKQPPDVGKALTSLGEAYSKLPDSSKQAISDKVMGALPKDVKDFAGKIGISKLDDFGKLGPAMPSVAKALDAAKEGKLDQAAKAMGEAVSKLPTEMQEKAKLAIADKILENPTAKGVLDKVGLGKAEDLAKAGDALPKMIDAGKALAKQPPDVGAALTSLGEAYSKLPESSRQAISDKVMGALPKDVKDFAGKIGISKLDDLAKVGPALGDVGKALDAAKAGKLEDAAKAMGDAVGKLPKEMQDSAKLAIAEKILENPTAKGVLDKVGLGKAEDLAKAGDALPKMIDAGKALAKQPPDVGAALTSLGEAYSKLPESSRQAISDKVMGALPKDVKDFAGKIGISKLDDLAKVGPALGDVGKALDAAKAGKLEDAAKAMGDAVGKLPQEMRDSAKLAIAEKILENPTAKGVLDKVGLGKAEDLAKAGDALPKMIDAGKALAKQPPDVGAALTSLGEAYSKLPESSRQAISDKVMGALPKDVKDFAGKIGISKLDDLAKVGPALGDVGKALDAAKAGKLEDAAKAMGDAVGKLPQEMRDSAKLAIAEKILENPTAKGVLDKVGLGKAEDLAKAGDALPKMIDAGKALAKQPPDVGAALTSLGEAYSKLPDSSKQAISDKVMGALPKDVKDFAGKIGINKLDDLAKVGPALGDVGKALDAAKAGKLEDAAKAMGDAVGKLPQEMRDNAKLAIAEKILENPTAKGVLDKVGLGKAEDLAKAGDALPKMIDAGKALAKQPPDVGAALTSLGEAYSKLPDSSKQAISDKVMGALPKDVKDFAGKIGINKLDDFAKVGPALGDLGKALDAAKAGKLEDAAKAMGDAVGKLPQEMRDSAKLAIAEKILENPTAKGVLDKVGLGNAADLAKAGDALPKIVDAGRALAKQPPDLNTALTSLGEAYGKLPDSAKQAISDKVMGALPQGVRDFAGQIGISKLDDLAKLGPAMGDVGKAMYEARAGSLENAAKAMGDAIGKLPDELKDKAKLAIAGEILKNPTAKGVLDKVGLGNAADLAKAGDALPKLIDAGKALGENPPNLGKALTSMGEAYTSLPESSKQAISDKVMGALPKEARDFMGKIGISKLDDFAKVGPAIGDVGKALDAAKSGRLEDAVKAMGDAIGKLPQEMKDSAKLAIADKILENPTAKSILDKVGLGASADLVKAGDALPKMIDAGKALAAQPPDFGKALSSLGDAYKALPDSARQALSDKVMGALPQNVREFAGNVGIKNLDDLAKLGPAMGDVGKAFDAAKAGKLEDAVKSMGDAIGKLPQDMQDKAKLAIAGKILENPTAKGILDKVGLGKAEDLVKAGDALPKIVDAGKALAAQPPDFGKALSSLGDAYKALPDSARQAVSDKIMGALPESVRNVTDKLGLKTLDDLAKLGPAMGDVAKAFDAAKSGKLEDAVKSMGDAIGKLPDSMKTAMKTMIAEKILENPTAKNLLDKVGLGTAADLVQAGDAVGKFVEAGRAMTSQPPDFGKAIGLVGEGIKTLPDDFKNKIINKALEAAPQQLKDLISKTGLTGADLVNMATTALPAMAKAAEALRGGNPGDALKALGDAVTNMTPNMKSKLINAAVDMMPVSQTVKDMLKATGEVILDPKVRDQFATGLQKLKGDHPDISGFLGSMAGVAQTIASDHPTAATSFLNTLGKLGGPIGKFFQDPELNKSMVESGMVGKLFGAVGKLTQGDMLGAMKEIGDAMGSLIGAGEKLHVLGKEMPISMQGLEALGRVFGRVWDIMPSGIKSQIYSKLGSSALGWIPIIGDAVNIGSSIKDVWDSRNGDGLDKALALAHLGSSIAGAAQVSKPVTEALNFGIGMAQVAKSISDLKSTIDELKNSFAGI